MKLSIISPVYKAEELVDELIKRIQISVQKITEDYEVILVEDGSLDHSWEKIEYHCKRDSRIKGLRLSRNFGQHYAITAGLDHCTGDWVVVMDCDLQDQPEEIVKLYNKVLEGYDVVFGRRIRRKDKLLKRFSSKLFYIIFNYLTESKFDNTISNFSIADQKVIENFKKLKEHNRSYPLFIKWMGFVIGFIEVKHVKRLKGKTSYTLPKLVNFAIESIVSQTNKPLNISVKFGLFMSFMSFILVFIMIIKRLLYGVPFFGWASLIVTIFFLGGLILANMGLLGLYIGKIFNETKNRPLYIVKETLGIN